MKRKTVKDLVKLTDYDNAFFPSKELPEDVENCSGFEPVYVRKYKKKKKEMRKDKCMELLAIFNARHNKGMLPDTVEAEGCGKIGLY